MSGTFINPLTFNKYKFQINLLMSGTFINALTFNKYKFKYTHLQICHSLIWNTLFCMLLWLTFLVFLTRCFLEIIIYFQLNNIEIRYGSDQVIFVNTLVSEWRVLRLRLFLVIFLTTYPEVFAFMGNPK